MPRMLFIKEDKQDGARANQRTADQPHEILSFTALHRYKRVGAVCEIRSLGEIAGFSIAVRKKLDLKMSLKVILVLLLYMFSKIFV